VLDFDALLHGPVSAIFGERGRGANLPRYQPQVGAAYDVDGVFDDAYIEIDLVSGMPANTIENVFGARLAAFSPPPVAGDFIAIPRVGKTFLVFDVRPDGKGWVQLRLNEA